MRPSLNACRYSNIEPPELRSRPFSEQELESLFHLGRGRVNLLYVPLDFLAGNVVNRKLGFLRIRFVVLVFHRGSEGFAQNAERFRRRAWRQRERPSNFVGCVPGIEGVE